MAASRLPHMAAQMRFTTPDSPHKETPLAAKETPVSISPDSVSREGASSFIEITELEASIEMPAGGENWRNAAILGETQQNIITKLNKETAGIKPSAEKTALEEDHALEEPAAVAEKPVVSATESTVGKTVGEKTIATSFVSTQFKPSQIKERQRLNALTQEMDEIADQPNIALAAAKAGSYRKKNTVTKVVCVCVYG